MNCNDKNIKDLLSAYRNLDARERKLVEGHVASCMDCRSELSLVQMMQEETVPDPGDAFWSEMPDRVYRSVQKQKSETRAAFSPALFADWFMLPRWIWTAAAVAIIFLISWFLINPFGTQEDDGHLFTEVYDHAYGSIHDPTLTHPSTNMSDLSTSELDTVGTWAATELSRIASQAEPTLLNAPEHELSDELAELDTDQIERLSTMLKEYDEEG